MNSSSTSLYIFLYDFFFKIFLKRSKFGNPTDLHALRRRYLKDPRIDPLGKRIAILADGQIGFIYQTPLLSGGHNISLQRLFLRRFFSNEFNPLLLAVFTLENDTGQA